MTLIFVIRSFFQKPRLFDQTIGSAFFFSHSNNKVLSDKPFVAMLWVSQGSGKKYTLDAFYSKRLAEADRTTRHNSSCA